MKKRLLIALLTIILIVCCLALTACHECEFGEWTVATPATCTEIGQEQRVCECGETEVRDIPATGHSYTPVVTNPSCTEGGFTTHTCDNCGDSYIDTNTQATGHSYQAVVTEPTCTAQGYTTYTCFICGDIFIDTYVNALGHAEVIDSAVDATCTTTGLTEGKHCSVCDEVLVEQTVVDALGHDEVEYDAQASTCTEIGWNAYVTCSRCDYSTYEEIPATGHNYVAVVTAPKCEEQGYTTHICHCGDSFVDSYIDAIGHNYSSWTVTRQPNCTENGLAIGFCSCGKQTTKSVAKLGHDEIEHEAKAVTCLEIGWDAYNTCSRCDYTTYSEILPTGHRYDTNIVSPTCTTQGYTTNICGVCGYYFTYAYVNALGHDEVPHDAKTPTCTEIGWDVYVICSRCDYTTYVEIPATGHTEVVDTAIAPTCTETGLTEGKHCSVCNEVFVATETVGALGHDAIEHKAQAPTCTEVGWDAHVTCSRCDYTTFVELSALGHDYISHEAQEETCLEIGWDAYVTCSRCDYTTYDEIPATGHSHEAMITASTCLEQGYTTHTCHCGDSYVDTYTDATGHSYLSVITAPTCLEQGYTTHTCVCGDSYVDTYVDVDPTAHDHEFVVIEPTCTEQGYTTHICHCGDAYIDNYVDALGHDEIEHDSQESTCTEIGWDAYVACSRCDYTTYQEISAFGHRILQTFQIETTVQNYIAVNATNYPFSISGNQITSTNKSHNSSSTYTITAQRAFTLELQYKVSSENNFDRLTIKHNSTQKVGVAGTSTTSFTTITISMQPGDLVTITYSKDGSQSSGDDCAYVNIITPANGMVMVDTEQLLDATEENIAQMISCTEDVLCYHCSIVLAEKLGHDEIPHEAQKPTCTEIGWNAYVTCSRCDYTTYEEISANGHSHDAVVTAPTCTEQGYTTYTCYCEDSYITDYVDALDHDYESVVTQPTCTKQGYTTYTCHCGESYIDNYTTAKGHAYGGWNSNGDGTHTRVCAYDLSHTETLNCVGGTATCTEKAVCVICLKGYGVANGHDYESVVNEPTCTEKGYTTYTCHCSDSYVDNYVDALGHNYGTWTSNRNDTHTKLCGNDEEHTVTENCNGGTATCVDKPVCQDCQAEYGKANGHDYEAVITAPTCTEKGYTTYTCDCNDSYIANYVAALGHTEEIDKAVEPTCTETGLTEGSHCLTCNEVFTSQEVVDAIGHDYGAWVSNGNGLHTKTCINNSTHTITEDCSSANCISNNDGTKTVNCECGYIGFIVDETILCVNNNEITGLTVYGETLTKIVIPNSVTSIGDYAFGYCSSLTSLVIPYSVTSIGHGAFYKCSSLTSIEIPETVTSIDDYVFFSCDSLIIYCEAPSKPNGWNDDWNLSYYPVVWNCKNNEVADDGYIYTVIDAIRYGIKDGVATVVRQTKNIVAANIPSNVTYKSNSYSVTSIGDEAFSNCSSLTSIEIPNSVTSIGYNAFECCSSLTSITIPNSVTIIVAGAFSGCSSLEKIEIPNSVTSIESYAFYGCSSLQEITIPFVGASKTASNGYDQVFGYIFGCSTSTFETISGAICQYRESVYEYYHYYIPTSLKTVIITGGESIDKYAFKNCSSLESIVITNSVTSIGISAFYNCSNLTTVYYGGTAEDWSEISISSNTSLTNATRYYYSETQPTTTGNYWHYDENGDIVVW